MKFFLDTANVKEIKEAASMGFLDGVTTNPTLLAKEKRPAREILEEICRLVTGPVSAEVIGTTTEEMLREARTLAKIAKNIAIKVPITKEGLKTIKTLAAEGIMTNATLCFTGTQALFAARAGATFVSPFVGRLDDRGHYGMEVIKQIRTIYANYQFKTEIIVASIRHPLHVLDAALMGADIATIPFSVFEKLIQHPLTDLGIQTFLDDYKKIPT